MTKPKSTDASWRSPGGVSSSKAQRRRTSEESTSSVEASVPRASTFQTHPGGRFAKGNPGGPGGARPGAGTTPVRERVRERIQYRLEVPDDQQIQVSFTPADRIARRLIRELEDVDAPTEYVKCSKLVVEMAYGTKAEIEDVTPRTDEQIATKLKEILTKATS